MLVAQTAPLEILPYPNEVKVHPGHYPFMSCQLVYPNALKNEADYLKQLLLENMDSSYNTPSREICN